MSNHTHRATSRIQTDGRASVLIGHLGCVAGMCLLPRVFDSNHGVHQGILKVAGIAWLSY